MTKTTNFQTSFCITGNDISDIYTGVKNVIYQWITGKEKDPILKQERNPFLYRVGPLKNLHNTNASVQTDSFFNDDEKRWAVSYRHPDKEVPRFWYIDIGLTQKLDCVVFTINVSYAWKQTYLGDKSISPLPNIPRVVKGILNSAENNNWKCYSGDVSIPIMQSPLCVVKPGECKSAWNMIENQNRHIPVIVVNGESIRDIAAYLAMELQGKAVIVHITDDAQIAQEILRYIPPDMAIRHGKIRVFFPVRQQIRQPKKHRFFDPKSDTFEHDKEIIIRSILKNYTLREADSTIDIIDITSRIKRLKLTQQLMAAVSSADESNKEKDLLNQLISEYDKSLMEKDEELKMFLDEIDSLTQDVHEIKSKLAYHHRMANAQTHVGRPILNQGGLSDFYYDEISIIIHAGLIKFQSGYQESGRIWCVIEDLIQANPVDISALEAIREAIDSVFRGGYRKLSTRDRSQLAAVGLTVTDDGKHHKMYFDGHSQRTVTFSKTASDNRSGENIIRDIKSSLGIGGIEIVPRDP